MQFKPPMPLQQPPISPLWLFVASAGITPITIEEHLGEIIRGLLALAAIVHILHL